MKAAASFVVEPIALDVERLPRPLDLAVLFGNGHPVELEIGMGKGAFLIEQCRARPHVNFIGLEWANWFWRYASDRLRRGGLANVRTARAEAAYFLREFVPDASLRAVHIYFPDPWPKARHNKRRLVQDSFMPIVTRVLAPGGRLQIVTDHADYFAQIADVLGRSTLRVVDFDRPSSAAEDEVVGTNFERKYRREGRPFHAIAAERRA